MLLTNSVFNKSVFYWIIDGKVKIERVVKKKKKRNGYYAIDIKGDQSLMILSPSKNGNELWTQIGQFSIFESSGFVLDRLSDCVCILRVWNDICI